jgi:hypothetical protein
LRFGNNNTYNKSGGGGGDNNFLNIPGFEKRDSFFWSIQNVEGFLIIEIVRVKICKKEWRFIKIIIK